MNNTAYIHLKATLGHIIQGLGILCSYFLGKFFCFLKLDLATIPSSNVVLIAVVGFISCIYD